MDLPPTLLPDPGAESVTAAPYLALPSRARYWPAALLRLAIRLLVITLAATVATRLPLPVLEEWLPVKNVVVAVMAILLVGKALYDTFFYDRFHA